MRVGAGGDFELVGNSDLLDPVLLKVFNVLNIEPGNIEPATLEKVKEVAAKNGVYETYKSNTSEREQKKDLKRMSAYQSKYPSMPPAPQSNPGSADPKRFAKRVKKSFALPSFPPPPVPTKKSESIGGPREDAASVSSISPPSSGSSSRPKSTEEAQGEVIQSPKANATLYLDNCQIERKLLQVTNKVAGWNLCSPERKSAFPQRQILCT